ncbi:MAG TPA: MMPL family transporter [Acidimicrobiales bacterium]|nr:MMPL family transporter [Acidimicrobiales bacterium]
MKNLARLCVRHRWVVLLVWVLLFVGVNAAARAEGSAYANTFSLPGTNSTHALDLLKTAFPGQAGDTDQIVIHATRGTVADHERAVQAALAAVARQPVVASVVSPFCTGPFAHERLASGACAGSTQVSKNGTIAYAVVHFALPGFKLRTAQIQSVEDQALTMKARNLGVYFGGNAFGQAASPSSSKGEVVGLVLTAVVLILAFGSLLAMLLPLGVALFALGVALGGGELLSHSVAIAQFAPILGSLIGLGVGIDYALFIITRARQGFKQGASAEDAIVTAINTSGRAVLFAGSTVCVALLGMLVLRLSFLNGVAVMATLAVLVTMLASVTLLPALVAVIGPRVLSRRERRHLAEHGPEPAHPSGPWQRWARFVSNHPRALSVLALALIVLIVVPFFSLRLGSSDQGTDPVGSTTRQAYDLLAQGFGPGFNGPLSVVGAIHGPSDTAAMTALDRRLAHASGVASVLPLYENPSRTVGIITVVPTTSPQSIQTTHLINQLRDHYIPRATYSSHTAIYVGGITAIYADFAQVLGSKLPLFVGVIVFLGCLLLMVAFRSLLIPLVAAIMNLLAVGASFGLVVAVFQWGWGSSLIRAGTGPIESFLPIIMIAILFGLSMDYQVFLVSRMHEEWLNTGSNEEAIVRGQANTGRVITAAALVMVSVFFSFAFGGQRIIAEFGIGLGGAVVIDAFIIRTVLVPALMHFIGRANWFMPRWLERAVPHVAVEATEE